MANAPGMTRITASRTAHRTGEQVLLDYSGSLGVVGQTEYYKKFLSI
jgi:hypothetical protein